MVRDLKSFTESLKEKEQAALNETMLLDSTISKQEPKQSLMKEGSSNTLSILQQNYVKMMPIINELHKSLVREDGEFGETHMNYDLPLSDDDDITNSNLTSLQPDNLLRPLVPDSECIDTQIGRIGICRNKKPSKRIDMRNMLGFLNQNLYHDYLNITNIMKLKRLDFRDVYSIRSSDLTITRENLIERIMILITSYF